jgi:hypothetical protein
MNSIKKGVHSCCVMVPEEEFGLSPSDAEEVLHKLRPLLERSPVDLHHMFHKLKTWFLYNAVFELPLKQSLTM